MRSGSFATAALNIDYYVSSPCCGSASYNEILKSPCNLSSVVDISPAGGVLLTAAAATLMNGETIGAA